MTVLTVFYFAFLCLYPGGGGVLNKFLYEEAPPVCPTPYPFYIPFFAKKVPLSYTFH